MDKGNIGEQFSHWITITALILALTILFISPVLAYEWTRIPFPGFMVEQTGVVVSMESAGWNGREMGINHPQRVIQAGDTPIAAPDKFLQVLKKLSPGDRLTIVTQLPDGKIKNYPSIQLSTFSRRDLWKFFWLPYLVGLCYFLIAALVYQVRGNLQAGRSFAYFCACASVTIILTFDLSTTHANSLLWTLSTAMLGGAISGLAIVFPSEINTLRFRSSMRFVFYSISIALMLWGWSVLFDQQSPWGYITPWRFSYYYIGLSLLFFFSMLIYRLRQNPTAETRQQIRIILLGSIVAFVGITTWFTAPLVNIRLTWEPALFLPVMLLFPLSVGFAMLRYRLWDFEVIIHRTLVYSLLTALLGSIYYGSVVILTQFLRIISKETTPLALVISTLVIASLFAPLRRAVQNWLDKQFFRRKYNLEKTLASFAQVARDEVELETLIDHLVGVVNETMQPKNVNLWLRQTSDHPNKQTTEIS
jgi:hypothetical protein